MKMQMKQNPLTGDWLCWIEGTSHAYYCDSKAAARRVLAKVNADLKSGKLVLPTR